MLETPQIVETAAQPAAVLHLTVPRPEAPTVMGPGYQEVLAAVVGQGLSPAGPWFVHHRKIDPEVFDFEIGIPVSQAIATAGRVHPGELPAARVARTVYHGPYEGLGSAWGDFGAWITAQGHTPASDLWERYVAGPESSADPLAWRTELNWPLAG